METVKLGSHFVIISHQFTSSMDALRGRLWLLWPAAIWCQSSCIFLIASVSSSLSGVHRFLFERGPLHSLPMSKKLQIQNKINLINLNLPVLCKKTILHDTPPFINWPYWANGGKWQELIRRRCSCSFFDGWITQTITATMKRTIIAIHIQFEAKSSSDSIVTIFLTWMRYHWHLGPMDKKYRYIPGVTSGTNLIFYVIQNFTLGFH